MMKHSLAIKHQPPRGFTLLEVLIALVVLSLGILGMAALQGTALKSEQTAMTRGVASEMANQITDLMRANKSAALQDQYNTAFTSAAPTGSSIAAQDLQSWKNQLSQLPLGAGSISHQDNLFTVTIRWDESRVENGTQQFVYKTEL